MRVLSYSYFATITRPYSTTTNAYTLNPVSWTVAQHHWYMHMFCCNLFPLLIKPPPPPGITSSQSSTIIQLGGILIMRGVSYKGLVCIIGSNFLLLEGHGGCPKKQRANMRWTSCITYYTAYSTLQRSYVVQDFRHPQYLLVLNRG